MAALLTAIYMLSVVCRAFFPNRQDGCQEAVSDPSWMMCLPLLFCAACTVILGIFSEPLIAFFRAVAQGVI